MLSCVWSSISLRASSPRLRATDPLYACQQNSQAFTSGKLRGGVDALQSLLPANQQRKNRPVVLPSTPNPKVTGRASRHPPQKTKKKKNKEVDVFLLFPAVVASV